MYFFSMMSYVIVVALERIAPGLRDSCDVFVSDLFEEAFYRFGHFNRKRRNRRLPCLRARARLFRVFWGSRRESSPYCRLLPELGVEVHCVIFCSVVCSEAPLDKIPARARAALASGVIGFAGFAGFADQRPKKRKNPHAIAGFAGFGGDECQSCHLEFRTAIRISVGLPPDFCLSLHAAWKIRSKLLCFFVRHTVAPLEISQRQIAAALDKQSDYFLKPFHAPLHSPGLHDFEGRKHEPPGQLNCPACLRFRQVAGIDVVCYALPNGNSYCVFPPSPEFTFIASECTISKPHAPRCEIRGRSHGRLANK